MPRGVKKPVDYNAEIEKIDNRIAKLSEDIKDLKEQKKRLIKKSQQENMAKVHKFIDESGMSAEEFLRSSANKQLRTEQML